MVGVVLWMLSGILNVVKNKKLKNMSEYNSNYEIAQAISEKIGTEPIPFDSVYEICLQIYNKLGGEPARFDSVYEILLGILPLTEGGGGGGTIEDVASLPDANQYKNKVVRLTTDNNLYQSVEISTGVWDWKALTNDWAVGAIYRYYNPDVAGTSYAPQEWITAILNFTMKGSTKEYLQLLQESGYGDGTYLMVHFKSWTGTEWIEDKVGISVYDALNVGGIFGSIEEFSAYINNILNVKANEYDAHNYIYITNFGVYLENVHWNTETMGFVMNDFSDAMAFPINTDIYPEYIELYPQKNE